MPKKLLRISNFKKKKKNIANNNMKRQQLYSRLSKLKEQDDKSSKKEVEEHEDVNLDFCDLKKKKSIEFFLHIVYGI